MYKIRVIQSNGHVNTEPFLNMARALDRFAELTTKKEKFSLDMAICLEELVNTESQEYQVHRIG